MALISQQFYAIPPETKWLTTESMAKSPKTINTKPMIFTAAVSRSSRILTEGTHP